MADKNFKVKNKLVLNGLAGNAGPLVADSSNVVDSTPYIATQYGGTGTTTSPSSGQVLYSASGTTYAPTLFSTLPGVYARGNTASRPESPNVGDLYYNSELNYFESYTSNGWFPIAAAPGIPTGVTATNQPSGRAFNNGQMSVTFTTPTNGGSPTSFIITPSPTTSPTTFTGSSSPITVTGLASSTQYTYTAAATSPYGTSAASSSSTGVTATTVPQAPTINSVSGFDSQAIISFTANATGGSSITDYSITSSPASTTTTQSASSSPYTFTGLTHGTAYTFTATATNANGTSTASSASSSVTPLAMNAEFFIVGGGGRGAAANGNSAAGGGGGGGYTNYQSSVTLSPGTTYTVTVGGSETGSSIGAYTAAAGSNASGTTGGNGGSGGGAGMSASPGYYGGAGGTNGGNGNKTTQNTNTAGTGQGTTTYNTWSGSIYYSGGGGGGTYGYGFAGGAGGVNGGGSGGNGAGGNIGQKGNPGTANTGGGGGGVGSDSAGNGGSNWGLGGSGICMMRYPDSFSAASSTTGSPTITVSGGYRLYKWTSSGSITI